MRLSNHSNKIKRLLHIAILWNIAFFFTCGIYANPVLDKIISGNASVSQSGNTTTINQSSQKAIINWNSFNVGSHEAVRFNQANGGVTLNRINPNQGASQIYGQITANGQVILVNPAGIFFGPGSYVNVGGLIATTKNISDANFLNGQYHFENSGNSAGAIINQGQIIAANHGLIALVGNNVRNDGLIEANMGKVVLASGEAFTMNMSGNDLVSFTVDTPTSKRATDENGNEMRDGVKNTGIVSANGGTVLISANTAKGVLDHAINLEGIVEAKSVGSENGSIVLYANNQNESVTRLAGKMDVSGKNQGEKGGKIEVSSAYILTDSSARLDASGDAGGGIIRIGGNKHGEGPLENATANVVLSGAELNADAIHSGNGGEVILWANDVTRYYGSIYARGGANAGNGGFVEVSGKNLLDFNGQVNTTAANGQRGMLLLDPKNIIIAVSGGSSYNNGVNNLFANDSSGDSIIDPNSLNIGTDITLQANNDITVTDAINMTGPGNALYMQAGRNININNNITVNGDFYATANDSNAVVANRDAGAGNITLGSGSTIDVGSNLAQFVIDTTATGGFTPGNITLNSTSAINAGTITLNTLNASTNGTITAAGALTASNAFNIYYGAASTMSAILAGTGALNIQGTTGILTVSGNNTYSGLTTVNSGATLSINNNNALGSTAAGLVINDGATLRVAGGINTSDDINIQGAGVGGLGALQFVSTGGVNGNFVLAGDTTISATNTSVIPYMNGVISGAYNLTKIGAAEIYFNANNTYTGTTYLNQGTIVALRANSLGSTAGGTVINSGTTLRINNAAIGAEAITLNGGTLSNNNTSSIAGPITLTANSNILSNVTFTVSGIISDGGNGYTVTKTGGGTLTLSGVNTYSGGTILSNGTLRFNNANALGTGNVTLNAGTLSASAAGLTLANNITLGGGAFGGTNNFTLSGILSGGALTKTGASIVTLSNANTYTGSTTISAGTLQLSGAGSIANSSGVALADVSSAILDINGLTTSINTLSGGGTTGGNITLGSGALTITQNSDQTYGGIISGTGSITKAGANTLTLAGANTYSGLTTISLGTLSATNATALGTTAAGTTIASGATLDINGVAIGAENITSNGTITGTGTASLAGDISNATATTLDGTGTLTLSGIISGAGTITKSGAGSTILSGVNTYTGTTAINAGTLQLSGSGSIANSSAVSLADVSGAILDINGLTTSINTLSGGGTNGGNINLGSGALTITQDSNQTYAGIISGTGSMTKAGANTLTLSGTNTYTGATNINSSSLAISAASALSSNSTVNFGGGNLVFNGTAINNTYANNINVNSNATISSASGTVTLSGNIGGSSTLTKSQAGRLSLTGDNSSFSGAINVNNGTLSAGSANALGSTAAGVTVASIGTLEINAAIGSEAVTLNGGTITSASTGSLAGNITLGANSSVGGTGNLTLSGIIDDDVNTYNLTKSGAGTTTLSGANTYDGTTNINVGTLIAANNDALGSTVGGTVLASGAVLNLDNAAIGNETITTGGDSSYSISSTGNSSLSGNIILGSNSNFGGDGNLTLTGIISDGGFGYNVYKKGTGTLTLSGVNTYTGTTVVNAGVLSLTASNLINNSSLINITSGGTLDFNFNNATLGNANTLWLSGTGNSNVGAITFTGSNVTLNNAITLVSDSSIGGAGSGSLGGVISGAYGVTKVGAGTLTLNNANTYTGATNIDAGTLRTTVANALSDSTAVTVASGATYNLNSVSDTIGSLAGAGNVTLGSASLSTGGNNTSTNFSGVISGTGGLVKQGTGTMNISGANTYTGTTSVQNGTLQLGANQSLRTVSMTNASGVLLDLNNYDLSVTNLSGGGSLGGGVNIGSGTLTMAPTNNSYTFAGGFSGNGNIIKNGIYRLDVGGTSSFTGTTTINDGVLRTTTSTALGGSGSTIVVNSGSSLTAWYQSILSNVQLNGGELEISQSGGVAGNVALLADSTYTAAGIGTISGSISGNHNLTVGGGYYLFLTGNNSGFTGGLTLNSANTYVQNVNALGTSAVTLNGGTLIFSSPVAGNTFANNFNVNNSSNVYVQSGTVTFSGALSGSGTFNKGQTGALTLSGDNSGFSGAINIANGTLTAAHANALGDTSNGVTIASGAILSINGVAIGNEAITNNGGSISGTNTASLAGDITLGANSYVTGTGSLTLSGVIDDGVNSYQLLKTNTGAVYLTNANTYDGGTSISGGGVLAINNSNSLGTGAVTLSNATLQSNAAGINLANNISFTSSSATLSGTNDYTLSGVLSGTTGLIKSGASNVTITGANNSWSGTKNINAGSIIANNNTALGTGTINVASGATLQANNVTLSNALSLAGTGNAGLGALYTSGAVNLNGAVTLTGDTLITTATGSDTLNFSNTINGARALTLSGGGTTTLGGSVGNTTSLTSLTSNNALNLGTASASNVYKTTGAQVYNATVNYLGSSATHTASSINYTSALTGLNTAVTATANSGSLTFNNGANVKSLAATGSTGIYINNADITTTNGQTYNNAVTLNRNTVFTMTGSGANSMSFLNGVYGGYATTLQGTGSGNYSFSLAGPLTGTYNVLGTGGGNNTLTVSSGSYQTININGLNTGTFASSNIGGLTFSNIQNITGGSQGNNFVFANNGSMSGTVDGGSLSTGVTNTLNFNNYTNALKVTFTSFNAGSVQSLNNLSQIALFNRINDLQNGTTPNNSSIILSSQPSQQVTISASMTGNIVASPGTVNFSNFQNMTSINSGDSVTITPSTGGTVNYTDQTVSYSNGVMTFLGFANFDLANQTNQVSQVVNQPEDSTSNTETSSAVTSTTTTDESAAPNAVESTQPVQESTEVLVGPACY